MYTIFNVELTIQNVDVVKRNDFKFVSGVLFFFGGGGGSPKYHLFKKVMGYPSEGGAE